MNAEQIERALAHYCELNGPVEAGLVSYLEVMAAHIEGERAVEGRVREARSTSLHPLAAVDDLTAAISK